MNDAWAESASTWSSAPLIVDNRCCFACVSSEGGDREKVEDSLNNVDGALGVDTPSMGHVHELRDEISALRETFFVNQKDLLPQQDEFLTLHSEQSAIQAGADVTSMDHFQELRDEIQLCDILQLQDDFLALRSERFRSRDLVEGIRPRSSSRHIGFLRKTPSVSPKAVLQLQDVVLRSERCALQAAVDDCVQAVRDEDTALREALPVSQIGSLAASRWSPHFAQSTVCSAMLSRCVFDGALAAFLRRVSTLRDT